MEEIIEFFKYHWFWGLVFSSGVMCASGFILEEIEVHALKKGH